MGVTIAIKNLTSSGTYTKVELERLAWALRYQALYHYNRSPWVERGYAVSCDDVVLLSRTAKVPEGTWLVELLDTSDEPGAIGYHEDKAHSSSAHSSRGVAIHPETGEEIPLAKVFVKTAHEDSVPASEVASHEMLEMLVDPQVMDESKIRKYLDRVAKQWYIGEVGDPVQERSYDVGDPEGRPCNVPEAIVADFAYPSWWDQPQTRPYTSAAAEFGLSPNMQKFELAPGGYMSVAPENEPGNWSQIYGSDKQRAQRNAGAYEGHDE